MFFWLLMMEWNEVKTLKENIFQGSNVRQRLRKYCKTIADARSKEQEKGSRLFVCLLKTQKEFYVVPWLPHKNSTRETNERNNHENSTNDARDVHEHSISAFLMFSSQSFIFLISSPVEERRSKEEKNAHVFLSKNFFSSFSNRFFSFLFFVSFLLVKRYQKRHCFWWNLQII